MKKSTLFICGTVFFTLTILARLSIKVEAQSFLVTPPMVQLDVFPGEEKHFVLHVINASLQEQSFRVYLRDLVLEKDGNLRFPLPGSSRWSCGSWIRIEPSEFILAPQNGIEVACKLSVPRGETGGRYAAIMVEPTQKPSIVRDGIISKARYRMTTFILLTVHGGKLEEKVQISEIKVIPSEKGKNEVMVSLRNEGNVHLIGEGKVIVKDANGRRWTEVTLEAGRGTIFPQGERNFKGVLEKSLPPGKYTVEAIMEYRRTNKRRKFLVRKQTPYVAEEVLAEPPEELPVKFSVQPSSLNVSLPPGAKRFFILEVLSKEEVPIKVRAVLKDVALSSGEVTFKESETLPQSCAGWIEIEPKEFYLQPNQEQKLKLSMSVPERVEGKYYAQLTIEASFLPSEEEKAEGVAKVNISVSIPENLKK